MRWLYRWLERRDERRAANAYRRRFDESRRVWLASEKWAQIRACKHESRRPNPDSMPREGWAPGEICNDCGIGIARRIAATDN